MKVIISDREAGALAGKFISGFDVQDVHFTPEGNIEVKVKYGFVPVKVTLVPQEVKESGVVFKLEGGIAQFASSLNMKGKGWRLEEGKLILDTSPFGIKVLDFRVGEGLLELELDV